MKGTRAAQRYAKAVFNLAKEKNAADAVKEDMDSILKTVEGSDDLANMIGSPVVKPSLKKKVLTAVFKDANPITLGAFNILLDNGRINILELVAKQYLLRYNSANQTQDAVVTTVVPLTDELEEKIQKKIIELTGNGATVKNVIDEDIIGGFVLRVGDIQYDASISNSLNNLKREFKNNTYVSKI
ncbi:ATP synthase F1 subunit delta [Salegentibacter chungangensis]|uniref:ATP synthase subunit delta n=1 Tax=Salegentibacter chungangensis TaxID=1335724 RepID=A0ABW3NP41_9FLAO